METPHLSGNAVEKSSGANLKMLWRYEQFFYPGNGWASGSMTREGSRV